MIDDQESKFLVNCIKRTIMTLKMEGFVGLRRRVKNRMNYKTLQSHSFVVRYDNCSSHPLPACEIELEIRQITAVDKDEIEELTAADEWRISKSFTLRKLKEGEHIYIAKHKGRIVASQSIVTKDKFEDPVFKREFKIGPNEAYCWRGFCVPAFRGRGIWPVILRHYLNDMALKYGRNNALGIVLTTNKSSMRGLSKIGWIKVGRVGFFEILGIRFHYLWGREAFKETRRRFFIQDMAKVHPVFRGVML